MVFIEMAMTYVTSYFDGDKGWEGTHPGWHEVVINNGSFELDWNDKFVANLIKQGYKIRPDDSDAQIVDRWFQTVCRNIALEVYEQQQADPDNRPPRDARVVQTRDLGNGRTEVS